MMRRATGIAFLSRTISATSGGAAHHRLLQAATISSCSHIGTLPVAQRFLDGFVQSNPSKAHGVAGTMRFSSVAAASLAPDAQSKFLPKDVVLYQYEACPFCNKVKGNS